MMKNIVKARTCVYNINYHIVWSVKYRRKVLTSEIELRLKELALSNNKLIIIDNGNIREIHRKLANKIITIEELDKYSFCS